MSFEKFLVDAADATSKLAQLARETPDKVLDTNELDKPMRALSGIDAESRQDLADDRPSWYSVNEARPTPRESEVRAQEIYGGDEQKSYKDGEEVPYGTKDSTRPDLVVTDTEGVALTAIEVKNYMLSDGEGGIDEGTAEALCKELRRQVGARCENMPEGTEQIVALDVRGQDLTDEQIDSIKQRVKEACADVYEDIQVDTIY